MNNNTQNSNTTNDRDAMMRAILSGQVGLTKKVETRIDTAAATAHSERDAMMRALLGGQAKSAKRSDDNHAATRKHITDEHTATRQHISDEHMATRDTLRAEIRSLDTGAKAWVGIAAIVVGIIAGLVAGYVMYPAMVQFFCWTVDTAGNSVQVADYALKLIGAKTAMVFGALACGSVFAWLTAEIASIIAHRGRS